MPPGGLIRDFSLTKNDLFRLNQAPYPGMKNVEVLQEIKKGYRAPKPDDCPQPLYNVCRLVPVWLRAVGQCMHVHVCVCLLLY